ncbi:unnamed protein product [Tuber aestivum]|uniref:Mediator of RNA polymerase II transcription subunit 11 n=1 Tax=Tuber aestivum TaxID=59557 RepID=A0A292PZT7_9PEZI|nr:unnamed protein product [Tuber aestivum]
MSPQSNTKTRILELNAIDKDISTLLSTASTAITTLTSTPTSASAFASASGQYHALLQSIVVRLRRQILLLEQADIPAPVTGNGGEKEGKGSGGGIDVGAFNSRNDVVGREMEGELWKRAKELVGLLSGDPEGDGDIKMG